jgi:hypothetical protein
MYAGLVPEGVITACSPNFGNEGFISSERRLVRVESVKIPASPCAVALVHACQIARKNAGFVASRASPDFKDKLVHGVDCITRLVCMPDSV